MSGEVDRDRPESIGQSTCQIAPIIGVPHEAVQKEHWRFGSFLCIEIAQMRLVHSAIPVPDADGLIQPVLRGPADSSGDRLKFR